MAFSKVLIANRGEIAVRVMKTAKAMGYATVAVYSDADRHARHVQLADEAVHIGASKVSESYLCIDKIIQACQKTGADAVHPGYGFLSENTEFAAACQKNGIRFIGPNAHAIELMGSKRLSKIAMLKAGVPCVPGYEGENQEIDFLAEEAKKIGFPIMVKASAGGGGRGMRLVESENDLIDALKTARSEANNAFGSGELILEKAVIAPRHVEIQVFGDTHGNYVYLFERDCSIQRRHQKVVEEAPCPVMTESLRQRMGGAAVQAAKSCQYIGAGTVEFLLDASGEFYFLEMNTRLQVEHPVTEMITGQDLVEWQLRVANGEKLPLQQHELSLNGHAIEVRLYAEDPRQNFLPQTGQVLKWQAAENTNVRIDHGMLPQDEISPFYDPMVAKVIAYGKTRDDAIRLLASAVNDCVLLGVNSNKQFLVNLLRHPIVIQGDTNTAFIAEHFQTDASLYVQNISLEHLAVATALFTHSQHKSAYWNTGLSGAFPLKFKVEDQNLLVLAKRDADNVVVETCGQTQSVNILEQSIDQNSDQIIYEIDGVRRKLNYILRDQSLYLDINNGNVCIENTTFAAPEVADIAGDGKIKAPMDGAIIEVMVSTGERVQKGQTLLILEAMKIQQQIKADVDGVVEEVVGVAGQQVKKRQVLMSIG
ncbi:acetyl/propionyl/methylcrotonyl-CoA carboxylase subunit alpha [Acinetobacter gerneri]|uniref:Biotin carboxylase n=1 Tax=Acinetobacter gerneri TaxID=202952 RepID=A0AAW8JGI9_9GAMM|nr:acetyl/propionyl/methylcrotonyl-CoA carboxylase subunit alpha [Acinetobacter gerneri]MDQ9009890.1 acetyl/propionyl/methylcrotonyl-CoA carboxylase subunit alpha [Acinetobacter gerneri]MDQ9014190.1 acetyl/propionyl/methylcrotonyl-CoA carboxylase subunit alpha [Acinetobacter gerneri]MDQ9025168.1 acetyl/propionyl/methylcrotonyl-CoA carboxylase subunit alpha [Acinetobacter gerneri]MDQ9050711.1 acetyl/propionyl/methylcrotonyl-CoA carboxylase subunit alpha [Acinetobacter gerneri]MDQ9060172.1 acety